MDSYFNQLMEIQNSTDHSFFLLDQDSEPRFVIEADKRTIIIPAEFQFLGVKTDQRSEKIYFEVDRIFDDVDLSTKTCVIQYINAGTDDVDEGIYPVTELDTTTVPGKIVFKWEVDNVVCKYAGVVAFSVRFYEIDPETKLYTYCWNTIPESLPVLDGLNVSGSVTEDFPTELLEWNARMAALNTEITNKISAADATMKADLKTAKGYMDGAQAARGGAEEAESRVKKIVAGNEAYTKVESDTMYAKSQVKESERGTSVEVYPEDGSNLTVTAYGFTEQAGSGDPSPTNVREIINGGLKLVKLVLNGTEDWILNPNSGTAASGSRRFQLGMSVTSSNDSARVVAVAYCSHFDGTTPANTYGSNYDNTFSVQNADLQLRVAGISVVDDLKQFLAARYDAGDPVIVWYAPADESQATGLYAPIILTSGEYRATCLPLTAPLCNGDSVVSWAKSGCDKVVTFDGSEDWTLVLSGNGWLRAYTPAAGCVPGTAVGDWLRKGTVDEWNANSGIGYVVTLQSGNIGVCVPTDKTTIQDFKAILAAHPLTVWYRSTNYTESADIPVSLETHQQAVLVLDGTESVVLYWNGKRDQQLANGRLTFNVAGQAFQNGNAAKCSHFAYYSGVTGGVGNQVGFQPAATNRFYFCMDLSTIGASASDIDETLRSKVSAYLAAQYAAGTPVTIVYQLATPITYAHPAVDIISNISERGNIVVSGQKEVSVSYHKSLDKTIVELDNKSYSKQESDNIFAKALRGTAEAAKSITIYPDNGSNVVATVKGFTKQEGSGDASLINIRRISNGGKRTNILPSNEYKWFYNSSQTGHEIIGNSQVRSRYFKAEIGKKYTVSAKTGTRFAIFTTATEPNTGVSVTRVLIDNQMLADKTYTFTTSDNDNYVCVYLADQTFTGEIIAWANEGEEQPYHPYDIGEYVAAIDGGISYCYQELTAPLCKGDKFITKIKSGCDKKIIVDGETKKVLDGGSLYFNIPTGDGVVGSTVYMNYGGAAYNSVANIQLNRRYFKMYGSTPDELNEYCKKHPLIIWYRTKSYTESSDIALSVETHTKNYFELAISDMNNEESYPGWHISGLDSIVGSDKNQVVSGAVCNVTTRVSVNTNSGMNVLFLSNVGGITQSQLKERYPDLIVQIVIPRSATITYAHDPINFIASPDEDGAWVITGEADGTVSAEYNKDITYAFNELQSAVLTAIAKLSL